MAIYQIISNTFVAGLITESNCKAYEIGGTGRISVVGDIVVNAAPIIHYMIGWNIEKVRRYCRDKHWGIREIIS